MFLKGIAELSQTSVVNDKQFFPLHQCIKGILSTIVFIKAKLLQFHDLLLAARARLLSIPLLSGLDLDSSGLPSRIKEILVLLKIISFFS